MSLTGCGHSAGDRPALLIIDTINDLEFEGAARILDQAAAASLVMRDLRATVRRCGAPIIYLNNNFGRWSEDRRQIVERACRSGAREASISRRLAWSLVHTSSLTEKRYGQAYCNRIEGWR